MDLTGQAVEPIWLALLSYFRQMWDYFGLMLHLYLAPDERLGREAVDIFLIGTVPSFLLRSTSALLLLGVVPGFIAGLGLVAFSHCQTSRSHKRRMKTGLIHMISEMNKDDYWSLFPKSVLPRWIEFSDLDKAG
ncbi:uncharacterized protein [Physcomitrium patens]|uniref:uncharacterized protein isoform X1 n=1 Tax=Physcomitrium patens TaxID=3218 RepID=UPI003CCCA90E